MMSVNGEELAYEEQGYDSCSVGFELGSEVLILAFVVVVDESN